MNLLNLMVMVGLRDEASSKIGTLASNIKSNLAGAAAVAGAALGAVGLADIAREAINASDATDKFKQTLNFAGLGTDEIEKLTADTKEYADKTVYSLSDIQNVTAKLAANGVADYDKLAEASGNLNAVVGGNAETFKSVAMAMTQTAGAGKLTTENWNQLEEAIPGASGMLQEAMKKNGAYTGNFREAMEKGEISAEEFNQAIMDLGMTDMAKEAATSTATFEGAMGNLQAAAVDAMVQIIDAIGKENITGFINSIGSAISAAAPKVIEFMGFIRDQAPVIVAAIAGIGASFMAFKSTSIILGAASAFKRVAGAVTALPAALSMIMSPVGLVVAAFAALAVGLVALYNNNETFRTGIQSGWESIKTAVGGAIETLKTTFTDFCTAFMELISALAPVIAAAMPYITEIINAAMTVISDIIKVVTSLIKGDWSGAWEAIKSLTSSVMDFIKSLIKAGIAAAKSIISSGLDLIKSAWSSAWNTVKSKMEEVWNGIKSSVSSSIDNVVSKVKGIKSKITGAFSGAASWLVSSGKAIINGLRDGISAAVDGAVKAAKDAMDAIRRVFPFSPAKEGPFSGRGYTTYSGRALMRDFGSAIYSSRREAADAAEKALDSVQSSLSGKSLVSPFGIDTSSIGSTAAVKFAATGREVAGNSELSSILAELHLLRTSLGYTISSNVPTMSAREFSRLVNAV